MQRGKSNSPPSGGKIFRYRRLAALLAIRIVILFFVVLAVTAAAAVVSVPLINSYFIINATIEIPPNINSAEKLFIPDANPVEESNLTNSSIQSVQNKFQNFEFPPKKPIIPFSCPTTNQTNARICIPIPPTTPLISPTTSAPNCPEYFRWIHEDLRPWRRTGITREMVERAGRTANFRLVLRSGRAFVQKIRPSFQTRDVFTLWGVTQLIRRYPGRLPELELMFDTVDWPVVKAADYWNGSAAPPPLFRYCGDDSTLDIVFPDWSFWGWPEINIKPWEKLKSELWEANKVRKWIEREPYAYWKGNPAVSVSRRDLLRCNISQSNDWNARIYAQDWRSESQNGYKDSNLSGQCLHRYKIYIEGSAWSVSEKYILACDSMALVLNLQYYDFFTRVLMPVQHYWPIRNDADKCRSIKFAVEWGNSHKRKAEAIGKEASDYIHEKLKMDYVYDYMFHLLNEYSKLQTFRPIRPRRAKELCAETVACGSHNQAKQLMMESLLNSSHGSQPCSLPPPFSPVELKLLQRRKANSIRQVQIWEQNAWESQASKYT